MTHVGEEVALRPVRLFRRVLRNAQLVFRSTQFGRGAFQLCVRHSELTSSRFGSGGSFSDALFECLVQTPQFIKALGILQGRTGDRRDEFRQPFFVLAKQPADIAMVDVKTTGRLSSHKDRSTQGRANSRKDSILFIGIPFRKDDDPLCCECPVRHVPTVVCLAFSRDHRQVLFSLVALKFEQQAAFASEKPMCRFAHLVKTFLPRQRGSNSPADDQHRVETIDKRQRGRLRRFGLRLLLITQREARTEGIQSLPGSHDIFGSPRPVEFHSDTAPSKESLSVLKSSPLPICNGEALIETPSPAFGCPLHHSDETGFPQCVRQVILKRPCDTQ